MAHECCPSCGEISDQENPRTYQCAQCGQIGFGCCIAGFPKLCPNCEQPSDEQEDEDGMHVR